MNSFLKTNKSYITYILILAVFTACFGFNFLINIIGNILLLILLIPLLLILIAFISFNSFKSQLNKCEKCGVISLGLNNNCINCGAELNKNDQQFDEPSQSTIEINAEEIK